MNVCFLLGSGISRPASLPSVEEITRKVLTPKNFFRWSDDRYRSVRQPTMLPECENSEMDGIEQLLRWLKGHAEVRYASHSGREVNYEDLAYLAAQIRDDHYDDFENPALGPLICSAVNSLPGMCSAGKLGGVAEQVVNFIADVVAEMLAVPPATMEHLRIIQQTLNDRRFSRASLFTLNHDCLLERFLKSEGIKVVDGFEEEDSLGIRRWNPALFDGEMSHGATVAVRLFKLHGSTNWRRFLPNEQDSRQSPNCWGQEYVGIRSNPALKRSKDKQGRTHEALDRALFLTGTFNKMLRYLHHVFLELHYRFYRILSQAQRLVVCGYGFGDKGVNSRIVDWMCFPHEQGERKMILIEPKSLEVLRLRARGAVSAKLEGWKNAGHLIHRQAPIGSPDVSWEWLSSELLRE